MIGHKFSIRLLSGDFEGHSINLVFFKPFWHGEQKSKFALHEYTLVPFQKHLVQGLIIILCIYLDIIDFEETNILNA